MKRWVAAFGLGATLLAARSADACGGMLFHSEEHTGTMSDQQVLIANGVGATVLVIGVGYKNTDQEFAFLLPLQRPPHHVADGDKELFKRLDEATAPRIEIIDTTSHPESGGGCSCLGGGAKAGAPGGSGAAPEVQVFSRGSTQTYEYVVVGGREGASLGEWLEKNGFSAPARFQSEIDSYLKRGWLFMAARLRPQANEGALAPIEIHYDAVRPDELEYPFELSSLSVRPGTRVDVMLYLLGNQPLLPENYPVSRIATRVRALSPQTTNYDKLFDDETRRGAFILEMGAANSGPAGMLALGPEPSGANRGDESAPSLRARASKMFPANGAVVRLRGRLSANQLHDMKFKVATNDAIDQPSGISVKWEPRSAASGVVLLIGLGLLRRKSRAGVSASLRTRVPDPDAS